MLAALATAELARRGRLIEQKREAEDDLLAFIRLMWHVVEPATSLVEGWPLDALCDLLMAVTDGHINRAIVNVPPGFMKSLTLNVFWPAWEWGPCNKPHLRYLSASYAEALPERDNIRFARVISDPLYQRLWGDRVQLVRQGAGLVENTKTGWKRTTSTHGSTTGHRAQRLLIDDANNPMDVESDAVRETTTHWIREIMPDRLTNLDRDVIINIQQRTHEADATGVLAEHGVGYTWLMIPMGFDPLRASPVVLRHDENGEPADVWRDPRGLDDKGNELEGLHTDESGRVRVRPGSPMAFAEGTLAWPERFSPDAVEALRTTKGPYAWASQYEQSPTVRGGEIIRRDWWQTWTADEYPSFGTIIASLDTAQEEHSAADYNALTVWGAFAGVGGEPKVMLIAAWRARMPLAELVERVAETCRTRKVDYLLVEHKTRGRDVANEIRRLYARAAWDTVLIQPKGDKVSRLNAVSHLFSGDVRRDPVTDLDVWSGGLIYAPDRAWADEVISEVGSFPRGAHDDYVDTVSMALGYIRRHGVALRKVEYEAIEEDRMTYRKPMGVPYAI